MDTQLENKIRTSFFNEIGFIPSTLTFDGEYCKADGYVCRIKNKKTIHKIHKLAWRLDIND